MSNEMAHPRQDVYGRSSSRMLGFVMNCFCFGGGGMSLPAFMSSLTLSAQRWGTPVVLMHHLEMKKRRQPPPPAAPLTASELQNYVEAVSTGLGGAFFGGSFGWVVAHHVASLYLILVW